MRISELFRGDRCRIAALPSDAARRRYLESLGLVRGASVEVVFAARYGCVVRVSGVRIAMSRRAAAGVEVSGTDRADSVRQSQFGQKHAV